MMGFAALYPSYDSLTPRTGVVPAKAGIHNHREALRREQAVTAEHNTTAWGYGSRIPASPRGFAAARKAGTTWGEVRIQMSNI
jgi:hypothetical protein